MGDIPVKGHWRKGGFVHAHSRRNPFARKAPTNHRPQGLFGLVDEPTNASVLPLQPLEDELTRRHRYLEGEKRSAIAPGEFEDAVSIFYKASFGGAGAIGAVALGALTAPAVGAVALLAVAGVAFNQQIKHLHQRRRSVNQAKRWATTPLSAYRREAKKMAGRNPHWNPENITPSTKKIMLEQGDKTYRVKTTIRPDGTAQLGFKIRNRSQTISGEIMLYPGVSLPKSKFHFQVKVPGGNLQNADFSWSTFAFVDLDKADLRGINFDFSRVPGTMRNANLTGASLTGADLGGCRMDDVILTGADVSGATLPADLTAVNITKEQFDSLNGVNPDSTNFRPYRVKEATMEELINTVGDKDSVMIEMWAGDIEVRDRATSQITQGEFDPNEHYVPHWELERLRTTAQ
jgi:hypothetical protein